MTNMNGLSRIQDVLEEFVDPDFLADAKKVMSQEPLSAPRGQGDTVKSNMGRSRTPLSFLAGGDMMPFRGKGTVADASEARFKESKKKPAPVREYKLPMAGAVEAGLLGAEVARVFQDFDDLMAASCFAGHKDASAVVSERLAEMHAEDFGALRLRDVSSVFEEGVYKKIKAIVPNDTLLVNVLDGWDVLSGRAKGLFNASVGESLSDVFSDVALEASGKLKSVLPQCDEALDAVRQAFATFYTEAQEIPQGQAYRGVAFK